MGIFKRHRRKESVAEREARWRQTQEIVQGIFPSDRYPVQAYSAPTPESKPEPEPEPQVEVPTLTFRPRREVLPVSKIRP